MRYILLSDIGGLMYWTIFKFCKTDLKEEQSKNNWSRNIFIFIIAFILILSFYSIKKIT
jgi:hypothetical protein